MNLNEKQKIAFDKILTGKNIFISGPGGVGKSFLVNSIMDKFSKSTVLLAPTGIAALNINGSTIHRTFCFRTSILNKYDYTNIKPKTETLFNTDSPVERIIIDEISMVRADLFKAIDQQLRRIRRKNIPFGGLQVIVVGDFYQLPPVVNNREKDKYFEIYNSPFCFGDDTWSSANFEYIELDQIMRQTDYDFISNLQNIRQKLNDVKDSVDFFNNISHRNLENDFDYNPVFLCTTNKNAELVNIEQYNNLEGKEVISNAKIKRTFTDRPSPQTLKLKYGTKVIFTVNGEKYINGEVGYVTGFSGDSVEITKDNHSEETILVNKHKWEAVDYIIKKDKLEKEVIGTYEQYPFKYAWAITIHKAQGVTLDSAMIDMGWGAFTSGQLYVALSRVKNLDGLGLIKDITMKDVIVDEQIKEFYSNGCKGIGLGV